MTISRQRSFSTTFAGAMPAGVSSVATSLGTSPSPLLLTLLFALEATALLTALALYKRVGRPMSVFLATPAGHVLIATAVATLAVAALTAYVLRRRDTRERLASTLALNVVSIGAMFVAAELTVRARLTETPLGPAFGRTVLFPRSWEAEAARNRAVLEQAKHRRPFLAFDSTLGWVPNPSTRSGDYNLQYELQYLAELRSDHPRDQDIQREQPNVTAGDDSVYLSSAEGLRSGRAGISLAASPARHRIALVGDSFTFGLEVRYEQTWGHQLEQALGADYQVLNFGVDGYGTDQAYLRYRRDVVPWHPDVVILGLVSDDLNRSMCVYGFLCFHGSEMPFPKPRLVLRGDSLVPLAMPLPSPESIFATRAIEQLPFVEYDRAFDPLEWQRHAYDGAYSVRYLLSRFRRWSVLGPLKDDAAMARVNGAVLRSFVREVKKNGSTPVIVFLPAKGELLPDWNQPFHGPALLRELGLTFVDATPCVTKVAPARRFVVLHYSPEANAAVAGCLRDLLPRIVADGAGHEKVNRSADVTQAAQ